MRVTTTAAAAIELKSKYGRSIETRGLTDDPITSYLEALSQEFGLTIR